MDLTVKQLVKIIIQKKKYFLISLCFAISIYPLIYALKYSNKYDGLLNIDTRDYITSLIITENSFEKVLVNTFKYYLISDFTMGEKIGFKCSGSEKFLLNCKIKSIDKVTAEKKIQDLMHLIINLYDRSLEETDRVMTLVVFDDTKKNNPDYKLYKIDEEKLAIIKSRLEMEKRDRFFLIITSKILKNEFDWKTYVITNILFLIFIIFFILVRYEKIEKK